MKSVIRITRIQRRRSTPRYYRIVVLLLGRMSATLVVATFVMNNKHMFIYHIFGLSCKTTKRTAIMGNMLYLLSACLLYLVPVMSMEFNTCSKNR